ncbi:hypothetical protein B7C51_24690 (plasmid) [Paenibacillus larvae subsp. pulvifaciens]|uniref:Uncharacterized protein n=1 Tax=Paenibacillus larvae subsp. pulvifaciens TaxID=1477 RepID=A0A1V0UZM3_9BACL|nr:hypothetical protein B7C51_24690 [Paenibacillus larvae subsp. pulvifaciens]
MNYIYYTDSGLVGMGKIKVELNPHKKVHKIIRQKTKEPYVCVISDDVNFIEESKRYKDINEFIRSIEN